MKISNFACVTCVVATVAFGCSLESQRGDADDGDSGESGGGSAGKGGSSSGGTAGQSTAGTSGSSGSGTAGNPGAGAGGGGTGGSAGGAGLGASAGTGGSVAGQGGSSAGSEESGGMAGVGGGGGGDQTAGTGGTADTGGMAGLGGTGDSGGTSGNGGVAGTGTAGTTTSGDGGVAGTGTAGSGAAGSGTAGTGTSGSGGTSGAGAGSGGAGAGGTNAQGGASGSGGGGGSGGASPKSGLPAPPTAGVARPSGTPGNLRVLNWAGFKGAVSYTFDDANSSQIQNYSTLQGAGVNYTFYLQTGKSDASNNVWRTALTDGHELGNHTRNHSSNDDGSDTDAATQFIQSTFGITVYTMAAPNGSSTYQNIARTRFLSNRGVSNNLVQPNDNTDPFNLPCYIPPTGASAATMNAQVDTAESSGGWRLFLVHGFTGGSDGAYQPVPLGEFMSTVNHSKTKNLWLDSVVNVVAYWRAQKVVTSNPPASSGGTTTYSWTLPDHFPPGMFLRVTVDGGTLRQGDTTLTWDDHGYYEVALDRGSVSVSP